MSIYVRVYTLRRSPGRTHTGEEPAERRPNKAAVAHAGDNEGRARAALSRAAAGVRRAWVRDKVPRKRSPPHITPGSPSDTGIARRYWPSPPTPSVFFSSLRQLGQPVSPRLPPLCANFIHAGVAAKLPDANANSKIAYPREVEEKISQRGGTGQRYTARGFGREERTPSARAQAGV